MAAQTRHSRWAAYFFLAPFLLIFCAFTVYPLFQSLVLSTQRTFGPGTTTFVGGENYRNLWHDPLFWKAVANTSYFAVGCLLTQMPCALGLAMLLNGKFIRGRAIFRLVFFSPSLMGMVFIALLIGIIFAKNTGLVNIFLHDITYFLHWTGLPVFSAEYPWLEEHVRPMMVMTALWIFTGLNMVYFLAALQNVSPELLEAAAVDGAGAWRRFWHVTLPSIRPVASYIALLSLLGSFQLFELPYILFMTTINENGPHDQGLTIVMYLYKYDFEIGNLGYGCTIGLVLAFMLIVFGVCYRLLTRKGES